MDCSSIPVSSRQAVPPRSRSRIRRRPLRRHRRRIGHREHVCGGRSKRGLQLQRAFDWATTPLESPEQWPEHLKNAIALCLGEGRRAEAPPAEVALRESERRHRDLFEWMIEAYCVIEMIFGDDGRAIDFFSWRPIRHSSATPRGGCGASSGLRRSSRMSSSSGSITTGASP
jgi:hypothetical protein